MKRYVKRLRIVFFLMLTLFAVGMAGVTLYLVTLDDDGWQGILTYWVERETGKRLTIAGDFSFTLSWHPMLTAEDVRLDGGEPSKPLPILSLGRLEVTASLSDLFRRVVHIERLRLRNGTFHIRLPPGDSKSEQPAASDSSLVPLLLSDAELDQVRMIVHPAGGRRSTRLTVDRFTVKEESAEGPLSLTGKGLLNGYPFSLYGRLGPINEFLNPTRPYDVELSAELAEGTTTIKGTLSDPINGKGAKLRFSVHLEELSEIFGIFYHKLPSIGPLEAKGILAGDFNRLGMEDFSLSAGDDQRGRVQLSGNVTDLTHAKGVHLYVEADLLDGERWRPVLGPKLPSIHTVSVRGQLADADGLLGIEGLELSVHAEKFAADLTGRIRDIQAKGALPFAGLELAVSAQTEDLSVWSKLVGHTLPPVGPLALQARLHDRGGAPALEELDLHLGRGKSRYAGLTGHIDRIAPKARPPISGVELSLVLDAPLLSDLTGFAAKGDKNLGPVVGSANLSDTDGSLGFRSIDITLGKLPETVRLTGRVDDLVDLRQVELTADIALANLSALNPLVGRELPAMGPVKGTLRMDDRDGTLQANPIDVCIGSRETNWIELTGHIADVGHFRNLDLNADVSLKNLTDIASLFGRELPSIGPVRGVATLSGSEKTVELTKLNFTMGRPGHDRVEVTGTVGDLVSWHGVDLEAQVHLRRLPILTPLVGHELPDVGPVHGHFKVEDLEGVLSANYINVALGTRKTAWLNLTGRIGKLFELRDVDLKAEAGTTALPLVGRRLPDLGPITASASISDGDTSLGIDGLRIEGGRQGRFTVSVAGGVGDIRNLRDIQVDVALFAKDLADISEIIKRPLSPVGPVNLKARLAGSKQSLHLSGLELTVAQSRIKGDVHYVKNGPRPRLTAQLESPFLAVKDLGLGGKATTPGDPQGTEAPAGDKKEKAPVERRRWVFGNEQLPLDSLKWLDLDGKIQIDHVAAYGEDLDELAVRVQLEDGRLETNLAGKLSGGGSQTTNLVVDARDEEADVTLTLDATDWDLGIFSRKHGVEAIQEGRLDAKVDLTARGDSLRQFVASLNGEATLAVRDGQLKGRSINLLAQGLVTNLFANELLPRLFLSSQRRSTPVTCAASHFKAANGYVASPAIAMETDEVTILGRGFIDFRDEKLHLVFDPKPKKPALFSLRAPIMITGTFANPVVVTGSMKMLLEKVAAAIGFALIDPLAALIPFGELGLGDHCSCKNVLHESGLPLTETK